MATWGVESSVTYAVEIAFGDDPWATSPTYTDVSSYVRNIQTFRGSTSEDLVISPGSMRLTLDNRARTFDNDYASGPYFGTVLPMRRVRFTATRAAVTFVVFTGWITGWQQDWGHRDGVAYADVVDGGYFAQNETLGINAYEAEADIDAVAYGWPLNGSLVERSGTASLLLQQYDPATTIDPISYLDVTTPVGTSYALTSDESGQLVQAAGDALTNSFSLEFWVQLPSAPSADQITDLAFEIDLKTAGGRWNVRHWYPDSPFAGVHNATSWDVDFGNIANNDSVSLTFNQALIRGEPHHIAVVANATDIRFYLNGALSQTQTHTGTYSTAFDPSMALTLYDGASMSGLNVYTTELSAARVLAHFEAGFHAHGHPINEEGGERVERVLDEVEYPTNLRDIDTGGTVQGPYLPAGRTVMDYVYEVLASERGLVFWSVEGKFTFRDRHWQWISADADGVVFSDDGGAGSIGYTAGSPASSTIDTVRNIVTASYSTVGAITRRDQTSIDAYGPSREFIDAPTLRNGTDASNLAAYVLREKKDPTPKIPRLTVQLREDIATNFAKILGLELGEVVTVERTPMGVGSQIVKRYQVRAIAHSVTPAEWVTEFYMSPAVEMADENPYLTIAHATYGRVGAGAGNAIPF